MNRSDLVEQLAEQFPDMPKHELRACAERIQELLVRTLERGGRAEIRGFGSFFLKKYPARDFMNPRSGVKQTVPAHLVPRFKPGLQLRTAVDHGSEPPSASPTAEAS